MTSRKSRKKIYPELITHCIESLSHDGRGIARINGKTVFVAQGLPGESVQMRYLRKRGNFDEAETVAVLSPALDRRHPACPHFTLCGGCSLQHIEINAQILFKQKALMELFQNLKIAPKEWLPPIVSPPWGYRRKARLGVKFLRKKNRVIIGFRERQGRMIADMSQCQVLIPAIGQRILELIQLIGSLSILDKIPQIEIAAGDNVCALIIRHLENLSAQDLTLIQEFGQKHVFQIYLQSAGIESIFLLYSPFQENLYYLLPQHHLKMEFQPWQFIQINAEVNKAMVDRALELLDCQPHDKVLDLFCGIGNFSLPIAQKSLQVTGVEGDAGAVAQARHNAQLNGIINCQFYTADLFQAQNKTEWGQKNYDKILIDPPRSGAEQIIETIPHWRPQRVVYVSCDIATLARDSSRMSQLGYRLVKAGIMDMFPHTQHAEAIALFEKS